MGKDLLPIHRLIYSCVGTLAVMLAARLNSPQFWLMISAITFVISVGFQYTIVHYVLNRISIERRAMFMKVFMVIVALLVIWSIGEVANYSQSLINTEEMLKIFAQKLAIYLVFAQLYIAGACAWRLYYRYGQI